MNWNKADYYKWIFLGCPVDNSVETLDITRSELQIFSYVQWKQDDIAIQEFEIHPKIGNLINLKFICLCGNRISTLPTSIGNLHNLLELSISNNKYMKLPVEIGNLRNLTQLDMSNNLHEIIPEEIQYLHNLHGLYLSNNRLTSFPNICNLQSLINLDISYNKLTSIPSNIGNLRSIKRLFLSNNQITTLPKEFWTLWTLENLHLSNNKLTEIPNEIENLQNLISLFLSENKLTTISAGIWKLLKLNILYMRLNLLTDIPADIENLYNIKCLNFSSNQLTTIPAEIGNLHYLQEICLDDNLLASIPAEIGNIRALQDFSIANNPIIYLPPNIRRLLDQLYNGQGIYQDEQSVHNSTIQQSIKASIMRLLSITPVLDSDSVLSSILSDLTLTDFTKQSIIEYSQCTDLISELNVTFLEVLTTVWNRIITSEHIIDIKAVLNDEMADAECKCFTGRVSRLVNCLSGVDELVEVKIADNEQIGNVISIVGDRLKTESRYSVELHKQVANKELIELGYKQDVVDVWLEYIE